MPMMHHSQPEESERRYDAETLRKVTALAARLQSEHQESLTVTEMEAIGQEVGLEPAFIRQALAHHMEQNPTKQESAVEQQVEIAPQTLPQISALEVKQIQDLRTSKSEFWAAIISFTLPMIWGTLAYACKSSVGLMTLFTLITPAPMLALLGFWSGRRQVSFVASLAMVLALAPTFPFLFYANSYFPDQLTPDMKMGTMLSYALFVTPMVASMGAIGASLRERFFPLPGTQTTERAQATKPVERSVSAAGSLSSSEAKREHRACLSVDLTEASDLRHSGPESLVEQSFVQYRKWVEEVARAHGGDMFSASGDSMMFLFPSDSAALRVARRLQEGVSSFNAALNRLPMPFRLRCGVSAGEISQEMNASINYLHTPMFDRAATLQHRAAPGDILVSSEVAAAALVELESLTPLPELVFGAPAFSWRAGMRAKSAG